jgi:hypothetical protein
VDGSDLANSLEKALNEEQKEVEERKLRNERELKKKALEKS